MSVETLLAPSSALLQKSGISPTILSIEPCGGGGNNRIYKLKTPDGFFIIKHYFTQNQDTRDRLFSEFSFLTYAGKVVTGRIPRVYGFDVENRLALYEYISGERINAPVTSMEIEQAIAFFKDLNHPEQKHLALTLPNASEACFSLRAHIELIDARIVALQSLSPDTIEDKQALDFIQQLRVYWKFLIDEMIDSAYQANSALDAELDLSMRCISPSDFGFHNALRLPNDELVFLDFEYAGWDDPAKMVGDFFAQLAVPVDSHYFESFVTSVMACFPNAYELVQRAVMLRPIYQVKWCCIALNVFLPEHMQRRRFANPALDEKSVKQVQLQKAQSLFQNLRVSYA